MIDAETASAHFVLKPCTRVGIVLLAVGMSEAGQELELKAYLQLYPTDKQ